MPSDQSSSHGAQPLPTGHPLPRRASPEKSITLRHHRLARDASLRFSLGSAPPNANIETFSPRRNSSSDGYETGQSDPKKWFYHSNQNPSATVDNNIIDIDPPFFQTENDSSNSEKPYSQLASPNLTAAHSSSPAEYRSIIDDLTVEIQMLREELKRYKQTGPDTLHKDKLFEIKIHGLPKTKKRELEGTLRDFAASLDGPPDASSSQKKRPLRHNDHIYSRSGFEPNHATPSSRSSLRPADSAYASMSTGAKSSSTSLSSPTMSSTKSSKQKVENYLRDISECLYPCHVIMADKERKKLVVRRLEQLLTGQISGRYVPKKKLMRPGGSSALARVVVDAQTGSSAVHGQPTLETEPTWEARILSLEQQSGHPGKKGRSGGHGWASSPNMDHTETGGNGNNTGSGINTFPRMPPPPEQLPTRPSDLAPGRVQIPSEDMDYIRHLGLEAPELLPEQQTTQDVHPDAEGWVYLNLLCNLAQLQMVNVTPDFVGSVVSEMSTEFQLSPDGRKIRWRGGSEGTKFSSDGSGYNSPKSPSPDDINGSEKKLKRQKTSRSTGNEFQSGSSRKSAAKCDPQLCAPSETFHYKPLFVQQDTSGGQTLLDETVSSLGPVGDGNPRESGWGLNGSGGPTRRKQRPEGAVIYYSGAPFCADLSGDMGDTSPTTQCLSSSQNQKVSQQSFDFTESPPRRTTSGSFINYRPLTDRGQVLHQQSLAMKGDNDDLLGLTNNDSEEVSDIELDLVWVDDQQYMEYQPLAPCGLGGVLSNDRFMVVVTTKRPKENILPSTLESQNRMSNESAERIIRRVMMMSTSPVHGSLKTVPSEEPPPIEIEYLSRRIERLAPVPLPPAAFFFPPFSTDNSTSDEDDHVSADGDDTESSEAHVSRRANPHHSDNYPDGVDLSSGDEDGDDPDESSGDHSM